MKKHFSTLWLDAILNSHVTPGAYKRCRYAYEFMVTLPKCDIKHQCFDSWLPCAFKEIHHNLVFIYGIMITHLWTVIHVLIWAFPLCATLKLHCKGICCTFLSIPTQLASALSITVLFTVSTLITLLVNSFCKFTICLFTNQLAIELITGKCMDF